jgi:hypothetical protein
MADATISRLAKQSGMPVRDVERMWNDVSKSYDSNRSKFSFIVQTMKRNLGLDKKFNKLHSTLLNKYKPEEEK